MIEFLKRYEHLFNKRFGWFFTNGMKHRTPALQARKFKRVVVTGGAGFIGSHLVKMLASEGIEVVVLDCLTYAGDMKNLEGCNYSSWWKLDISDMESLKKAFQGEEIDAIIHLAAESHVDRSIEDPLSFVRTNVVGTTNLLEIALGIHKKNPNFLFYHVSTDEVFGSLSLNSSKKFREITPYDPRSPYSASKASSDHFVRAYHHTYGLPVLISNCSNNYGTHQYPEKLIPVVIKHLVKREKIPVYGSGENIRDWLHVFDHTRAIFFIMTRGKIGETYCVGGDNEIPNIDLVKKICDIYDNLYETCDSVDLIEHVKDRKGHDLRYAIDSSKLKNDLGWEPMKDFDKGLEETIKWYVKKFYE